MIIYVLQNIYFDYNEFSGLIDAKTSLKKIKDKASELNAKRSRPIPIYFKDSEYDKKYDDLKLNETEHYLITQFEN